MTKTTISFEIYDISSDEILVDNVPFDDIPELLVAYQLFTGHDIECRYRELTVIERVHVLPKDQFKSDWFELMDYLIDNLYHS